MTVKILGVEIDEDTQIAQVKMTPESEQYIQKMFPDLSMAEAVQAYFNLAAHHTIDK